MTSNNDKDDIYKFSFDGITLGEAYRQYRKLLLDEAAGTTDESGSSLADHLLDIDMGGAGVGAPVMVGGLHGPKFQRLRMTRAKKSYKLVVLTQASKDVRAMLSAAHFQDGRASIMTLDAMFNTGLLQSDIDRLDDEWRALSIPVDVGVHEVPGPSVATASCATTAPGQPG